MTEQVYRRFQPDMEVDDVRRAIALLRFIDSDECHEFMSARIDSARHLERVGLGPTAGVVEPAQAVYYLRNIGAEQ